MCMHINPLECIIPPHMNKNIAENGSPEQQEKARNALTSSARLRAELGAGPQSQGLPQEEALQRGDQSHFDRTPGTESEPDHTYRATRHRDRKKG